ncbi:MAG: hypothetical protein WEA10_08515 [Actinomycetota bacterium]
MRRPRLHSLAVIAIAVTLVGPSTALAQGEHQGVPRGARPRTVVRPVAADLIAAALRTRGRIVRDRRELEVARVERPGDEPLWRVEVRGAFPPRAQRYVFLASGRPVAYGIPAPDGRTLRGVTDDPIVRTGPIVVRYGTRATAPPGARGTAPPPPRGVAPETIPDPAAPGPYEVTRQVYKLGNEAFQPTNIGRAVELVGDVHYPTGLPDGPYPLVLFMHGNHSSCFMRGTQNTDFRWPCRDGWRPIPNFAGYDYVASSLASWGYIVVSVGANGVNVLGSRLEDTGMRQRGEVIGKHIDLWSEWSDVGGAPFGTTFVGQVDLARIGVMGHSRGGEGAVWSVIVDRERADPYGIDGVLALAPVDFTRVTVNDVPLAVVLPTCDGDVFDLQGVHFFDDARYLDPGDPTPKHTVTVFGANHNFFNTVWSPGGKYPGAFDDGFGCPAQLSQRQERRAGAAYIAGFFRRYVGNETAVDPMWTGQAQPESLAAGRTLVSYLAPDLANRRLDVDRYGDVESLFQTFPGGSVVPAGISTYGWCANSLFDPCQSGNFAFSDRNLPGLGQGTISWSEPNSEVRYQLPPGSRDVSGFDAFQFRAAQNPSSDANGRIDLQDLTVALIDGNGDVAQVAASAVGNAALARMVGRGGIGHILLNQVRFPLEEFDGIDLDDVRTVELRFDRTESGSIHLADLAFSRGI